MRYVTSEVRVQEVGSSSIQALQEHNTTSRNVRSFVSHTTRAFESPHTAALRPHGGNAGKRMHAPSGAEETKLQLEGGAADAQHPMQRDDQRSQPKYLPCKASPGDLELHAKLDKCGLQLSRQLHGVAAGRNILPNVLNELVGGHDLFIGCALRHVRPRARFESPANIRGWRSCILVLTDPSSNLRANGSPSHGTPPSPRTTERHPPDPK